VPLKTLLDKLKKRNKDRRIDRQSRRAEGTTKPDLVRDPFVENLIAKKTKTSIWDLPPPPQ